MKVIRFAGLVALSLAVGSAQDATVQTCRANVANALGVSPNNVDADYGRNGDNGNPVIAWETDLAGRRVRGFCETSRGGGVISTQLGGSYAIVRGGNRGGGGGFGGGAFGNGGGNKGSALVSVKVDTSGKGSFSGMGQNIRITRGWVNTEGPASVSLSGQGDFKITFFGTVDGSNQDREFILRITRSDRGNNAEGTAVIRLNSNRSEVESIRVDGRLGGNRFNGSFLRD